MKSTAGGLLKGFATQMTAGIPFAPELMDVAGAKIKSMVTGRGVSEEQKEMASMLGSVGKDGETGGDAEANGGESSPVEKVKEELLGGGTTGGSGGGLAETNEILRDILEAVKPDRETAREEERESDVQHKEHMNALKKAGGIGAAGAAGAGAAGDGWILLM